MTLLAELLGCAAWADPAPLPAADLVFRGGPVYTMRPGEGQAESSLVAVRGDRIVYVGPDRPGLVGPSTLVVNLAGKALFPGFVDAHVHLVEGGVEAEGVVLGHAQTVDEMVALAREWARRHPDAEWVVGGGWDASTFNDVLRASQLDVVDRPVFLASADGHSAWVNHAALREAGVEASTPDPDDGRFERDALGNPNGTLRETAVDWVAEFLPEPPPEALDRGLAHALGLARAFGITAAVEANADAALLGAYARAEASGTLGLRVHAATELLPGEHDAAVAELEALRARFEGSLLRVDAAKFYVDGVVESQTAALVDPYDTGASVPPAFTRREMLAAALAVDAAGFELHAHAIGDAAVRLALDAVETVERAHGRRDRHPVIAHVELVHPDDLVRFATTGALAAFQPLWAFPDPYVTEWTVPVVGPDRAARLYPLRSVANAGGALVGGSDWSVSSMNPWEAIEVAVTRADPEEGGPALAPAEAISLREAIAAYTRDGALALGMGAELGTIEVGKLADLVVVDKDPFTLPADQLSSVRVTARFVGGRDEGRGTGP